MVKKPENLPAHSEKIAGLLRKSRKPMSAYEILDKLRPSGVKAPQTVYRALEPLITRGLVHRIESQNAFIACHGEHDGHTHGDNHAARFAICRNCGTVEEICDQRLGETITTVARTLKFTVERDTVELLGICSACTT